MIKRTIAALESIAESLRSLAADVRAMRAEQEKLLEISRRESEKGPAKVLEIFEQVKVLMGPKG